MIAKLEPEVIEATLKAWGCPYSPLDPLTRIWLQGYHAGSRQGFRDAGRAIGVDITGDA